MNPSAVTLFRLAVLCALGTAATTAGAQSMVTARVRAQPVVEQVPVSDCGPYGAPPSGAGAAVGALTGGLIGSQLGKGSGHIAGAVLGALGGAFLGNAAEATQYGGYGGCATRYSQRVTGYDVVYEVAGRSYQTRMAQAPGQWIQVPAPDAYHGQPAWGAGEVQSYPVAPPSLAGYPMPVYPAAVNRRRDGAPRGAASPTRCRTRAVTGRWCRRVMRRPTRRPMRRRRTRCTRPTRPRPTRRRRCAMWRRWGSTCRSAA